MFLILRLDPSFPDSRDDILKKAQSSFIGDDEDICLSLFKSQREPQTKLNIFWKVHVSLGDASDESRNWLLSHLMSENSDNHILAFKRILYSLQHFNICYSNSREV